MSADDRERRTLEPTPKRVADFRKRGELALSRDLTAVASMGAGAIAGLAFARASFSELGLLATELLGKTSLHGTLSDGDLASILARAGSTFVLTTLPPAIGAVLGYAVSTGVQLGFPPAFVRPKLDLLRPFSLRALPGMLSPKAAGGRALKAIAKLGFVGFALIAALQAEQDHFRAAPALTAGALLDRLISAASRLALYAGGALAALAIADYALARRTLHAKMRMTPEEMKRELRDQDGDPQIKRRRRQRMRELSKQRLATSVKTADVVVVNPTHFAVALRYRSKEDRAPRVVAKGKGAIAERIRELARKAGVPILPQPPLARLLYKLVPEGREIPANLYQAVAEVLAYVYRLKRSAR